MTNHCRTYLAGLGACLMTASVLNAAAPVFSLAWSEYPSWSVFGVAHMYRIIDGREGRMGPIEEKWGVDIVLKEAEYDPCLTLYGAGQCDAVCITNMDALNPSLSRPSVMILPTSTSYGADACIVVNTIADIKALRGKKVLGLEKSVSEYCFVRNLELLGEKESDHNFANMDPGAAALAMQQGQSSVEAIVVWNPFVMETLNKRKDVKVLFDSTTIPSEIIDTVTMAQTSLDKPGGKEFACAIIDAFYAVNERMAKPDTREDALIALGEKFSHLDAKAMEIVVQQTKFYGSSKEAISLMTSAELKPIMKKVADFCVSHEIADRMPVIGYGTKAEAPQANLRIDPSYVRLVAAQQ